MSKPCNRCGEPIDFKNERGRYVPINPADRTEHRTTCLAQRGQVDGKLKHPTRHHVSQYRIKRFLECQLQSFFADVQELEGADRTPEMQAGTLVHGCLEFVAVEASKAGRLAEPVAATALLAALEVVAGREEWAPEALALARTIIAKQAEPLDFSFAYFDEHGIAAERAFELPCGDGVIAGGVVDLVERVGDETFLVDWKTGARRDEDPQNSPQAGLYLAWGRATFGPRVRFVLRYLALEGPADEVFWTPELEENAKAFARALVTKSRMQREDASAWPATYGSHCARCPFTARCETYQAKATARPPEREPVTLAEIAPELEKWEPVATVATSYVEKLRKTAKALASDALGTGEGKLVAGDFLVRLSSHTRKAEEKPRAGGNYQLLKIERLAVAAPLVHRDVKPANITQMPPVEGAPGAPAGSEGTGPGHVASAPTPAATSTPVPSQDNDTSKGSPRATTPGEARPMSADAPASAATEPGRQNPEGACAATSGGGAAPSSVVERAVAEDPDDAEAPSLVPLCCSCGKGGHEHRATVFVESVSVHFHADACVNDGPHPVVEAGVFVHFVCGSCWPSAKTQLEAAAREQLREKVALLAPKPDEARAQLAATKLCAKCKRERPDVHRTTVVRQMSGRCAMAGDFDLCPECRAALAPADELRETPKESAGFNEASLSWICKARGCGRTFDTARGLNAHKRTCAHALAEHNAAKEAANGR